jgi:hypothetical protein
MIIYIIVQQGQLRQNSKVWGNYHTIQNLLKHWLSVFCVLIFGLLRLHLCLTVSPVQHFLAWLTPERKQLLNGLAFDRNANRALPRFSRFMKRDKWMTFERAGLLEYYPLLRLVGYLPPSDVWEPTEPLSDDEASTDLRTWFTPLRRELISRRAVDRLSHRPLGVLNRYLNGEPGLTFKIVGIEGYYPVMALLGFIPPEEGKTTALKSGN